MNRDVRPIGVCFIAPKAYPLFNRDVEEVFGGAEVDLYLLAHELAKDGNFKVSFITADYGQEDTAVIGGVTVIKSLDFKKNPLSGAIRIWQAMRKANADVYMLKTASPGVPLVAIFCSMRGRAFVYRTAHEYECDGTYLRQHAVLGRIFKLSLKSARLVFTQNETDRQNLKRTAGVDSIVIPNGHPLEQTLPKQRDMILWVGRTTPFKRAELFIELAKQMPAEQFTMICQRADGDQRYEHFVARAESVENLEFIPRVAFAEIDGYFRRAKLLVNTSESEGFSNTFIQACQCSSPILSLRVNPDSFLTTYKCGLCADDDWNKFVEHLKTLLDPDKAAEYGQNARKYAEEKHDIKKIAKIYTRLFTEFTQE
ncbi:MAG TPA: glycosyltransferase family 4 protein [Sedimentisphaerales bacterium]|nr:glycosyltransferase family 4 protein [Sedimentisphaerales bacterium]